MQVLTLKDVLTRLSTDITAIVIRSADIHPSSSPRLRVYSGRKRTARGSCGKTAGKRRRGEEVKSRFCQRTVRRPGAIDNPAARHLLCFSCCSTPLCYPPSLAAASARYLLPGVTHNSRCQARVAASAIAWPPSHLSTTALLFIHDNFGRL